MSKKETTAEQPKKTTFVDTLLLEGKVTLTAKTREELTDMVNEIPAEVKYSAGAVGQNFENGAFSLEVFVLPKN